LGMRQGERPIDRSLGRGYIRRGTGADLLLRAGQQGRLDTALFTAALDRGPNSLGTAPALCPGLRGGVSMEERRSASQEEMASAWPRYQAAVLGFRNYWYPVMFSYQLGERPRSIKLLGEKILLVRHEGRAYALHDRCPHRGVPLSLGRRECPGTISCAYHGWTYDLATGDLVAVLTDGPDSPIVGKRTVQVRTYPVEERAGLIFVYVGEAPPPRVETDIPPELLRPSTVIAGVIRVRPGNWRYAAENGIDEGHAGYLHRGAVWALSRQVPAWRLIHVGPSEDGEWMLRIPDRTVFEDTYPRVGRWPPKPFFWQTRARGPIAVGFRLPCWLRINRPNWSAYEVYVPADETHYRSVMFLAKQAEGLQALWFRAWYWLYRRWAYHGQFNGQDQEMIEAMQIPPERLYRPDVSITAWRKLCEQGARRGPAERDRQSASDDQAPRSVDSLPMVHAP
jgi:phenylpropionate dioxygenase-like ring-hydroxylating dioxygenase large terminal subunit